ELTTQSEELTKQGETLKAYGEDQEKLKNEVTELCSRVEALEKTTQPLNLRIVLDEAREKLLNYFNLDANDYIGRSDDLVTMVQTHLSEAKNPYNPQHIPNAAHLLAPGHLDMIFKTSDGDLAAHEVLAEAVLTAALSPGDRQKMVDIFTYTHGVPPTHRKAASNAS
ncbi:hypothetical protein C0991_011074, partial [Blastosporella zonata]